MSNLSIAEKIKSLNNNWDEVKEFMNKTVALIQANPNLIPQEEMIQAHTAFISHPLNTEQEDCPELSILLVDEYPGLF